jgi:hypothetical protein
VTALAQGSAGLALVMGFALLASGQVAAATVLLAVQSGAVAVTAVVLHQPLMAIPPLILGAGAWWLQHETAAPRSVVVGGVRPAVAIGAVLAVLCQSLGGFALPAAIVLLSILLAATRSQKSMQVLALVALQNGVALAGSLIVHPDALPAALLFPLACLLLPLPLAVNLLVPGMALARGSAPPDVTGGTEIRAVEGDRADPQITSREGHDTNEHGHDTSGHGRDTMQPAERATATAASFRSGRNVAWLGWFDLGLALVMAAATVIVPLDPLASLFAPLLALDGVLRSCVRRNRHALTAIRRGVALAQTGFTVLAVCAPDPATTWLAVLAAMTLALLPTLSRRWASAVLANLGAGLALIGILLMSATPPLFGWFSLFVGLTTIAAAVPDLAVVVVILMLRLANQAPWPSGVETLGISLAVIALLACALLLTSRGRSHRITLLMLSQATIAALAICTGQAEGRFTALVMLILLILSRSAVRIAGGPTAALAMAGLAGVPPFGVFPGLVLVVLALSAFDPWLLLPTGAALLPIVLAGLPVQLTDFRPRIEVPSIAWLPLVLAILAGYFAPDGLVQWWRVLTAGSP